MSSVLISSLERCLQSLDVWQWCRNKWTQYVKARFGRFCSSSQSRKVITIHTVAAVAATTVVILSTMQVLMQGVTVCMAIVIKIGLNLEYIQWVKQRIRERSAQIQANK